MKALLHRSADKYLNRLNTADRDRIDAAIEGLEKESPEGDITNLADDYWNPVIEEASSEEAAMIDKRVKEYDKDPSSFVSFKKRKK